MAARPAAIDLHCHILPGLDDGAVDLDDAIEMARQARRDGITTICATPHIRADHEVRIEQLPARIAVLQEAVESAGITIAAGAEVAAAEVPRLSDADLRALTLGGSGRWILLEPEPGPLDERLDRAAADLLERGLRPLIAHPERHPGPDLVPCLRRLVARGALVQATAAMLLDPRTRPGMFDLARTGLIHVLGSDSHSSRAGRPVALRAAIEALGELDAIAPHLGWIAEAAPDAIVSGREITPPF